MSGWGGHWGVQLHKWGDFTTIIIFISLSSWSSSSWSWSSFSSHYHPDHNHGHHADDDQVKHGKAVYTWKAGHKEEFVYEKVHLVIVIIGTRSQILPFHMWFGIIILSPFHPATWDISFQNISCPINTQMHAQSTILPFLRFGIYNWKQDGIKIEDSCVFGHFIFWMGIYMLLVARWNRLKIQIPKHIWKKLTWLLEQK